MQKKFPAGGTDRQRAQSQAAAEQADERNDYTAASIAWADRAGQRDPGSDVWLGLARDLLRRPAPDPAHALDAAWVAYRAAQDANTPDQNVVAGDALVVMREALFKLDRPVAELDVLTFASQRLAGRRRPADTLLAQRRQEIGLLLRGVRTESESFPASACLTVRRHSGRPAGLSIPQDWVKLSPAIAGRGGDARRRRDLHPRPAGRGHDACHAAGRDAGP